MVLQSKPIIVKKKKIKSYKRLMKDLFKNSDKNIEEIRAEHKETILKNVGGGKFSKIDKL